MTALLAAEAFLYSPSPPQRCALKLHASLQRFAWTEADAPGVVARRGHPDEPLFCLETALKASYLCLHSYRHFRVSWVERPRLVATGQAAGAAGGAGGAWLVGVVGCLPASRPAARPPPLAPRSSPRTAGPSCEPAALLSCPATLASPAGPGRRACRSPQPAPPAAAAPRVAPAARQHADVAAYRHGAVPLPPLRVAAGAGPGCELPAVLGPRRAGGRLQGHTVDGQCAGRRAGGRYGLCGLAGWVGCVSRVSRWAV